MERIATTVVVTAIITALVMLFVVRNTTWGVAVTKPKDTCELTSGTWTGKDLGAEVQVTEGICLWGDEV